MITDKNKALEAIRTRNPNVLDQISPELQDDMDIAMRVAEVFELQLRNTISLNGQDNSWNKAKEIMHEWDILARQYREKEETAQARGLIIDEDKALEAIRNGEAKLKDIMPEIIDKKMILEAIKQYGKSEQSYILNSMPQVKSMIQGDREFRQEIKGILDEQAKWEMVDKKIGIKEEQAKEQGLITDMDEALDAIRMGKAKLKDVMKEIVTKEMVLEAIKQYGNSEYAYATAINVPGVSSGEFKKEARAVAEQRKKQPKTVENEHNEGEASKPMYSYNYGAQLNFEKIEDPEKAEPIDYGFEAPEAIDYGFETPETIDYGFEAPEPIDYEFEAPEQPAVQTSQLGDEVSIQDGEREELTNELMRQIELVQDKSDEVAKLDKGIAELENLERQYANELDKYKTEGKEF